MKTFVTVLVLLLILGCTRSFSQVDSLRTDTLYVFQPNADLAIFSGAWIPNGKASVLGTHPFLGLKIGVIKKKFEFGVIEEFRFVRSPNDYQVEYDNTIVTTHQFFGFLVSGYGNYTLMQRSRSELFALAGLGWDDIEIIKKDPPKYSHALHISRLNKSLGIGWRFHVGNVTWRSQYLGVECAYNFVDYSGGNGTPLNGNSISIRLIYGAVQAISFGR